MSTESKRAEGAVEQVGGKIKSAVGAAIGNEQMEAEGDAKDAKGEAKQQAAKVAGRAEGKLEQAGGALKNAAGKVLGNEQMQAEGEATKLKGEAREAVHK